MKGEIDPDSYREREERRDFEFFKKNKRLSAYAAGNYSGDC